MNHLRGHMANMNETRFHLDRAIPVRSNDHGRVTKPSGSTASPTGTPGQAAGRQLQCGISALAVPRQCSNNALQRSEQCTEQRRTEQLTLQPASGTNHCQTRSVCLIPNAAARDGFPGGSPSTRSPKNAQHFQVRAPGGTRTIICWQR